MTIASSIPTIVLKPNIVVDIYYTRSIFHQPREVKLVNEAHAIQQGCTTMVS